MNGVELNLADLSGALLGFTFTIFILSYMIGDNPFFRVAIHIFIGVSAAYATAVTFFQVILPQLVYPFFDGEKTAMYLAFAFLIPSLLLLTKLSSRWGKIGSPAVAIIIPLGKNWQSSRRYLGWGWCSGGNWRCESGDHISANICCNQYF
jgi:hypothetical protein